MPINIPIKTAPRITLDGVCAVLGVSFVIAYLIAPQFVAGLIWTALTSLVNYWN
jgi:hypothetical protein